MQYDAAVDPVIAKTKVKEDSQVAGRATVLVVPDLSVGNIVYKVMMRIPSPPRLSFIIQAASIVGTWELCGDGSRHGLPQSSADGHGTLWLFLCMAHCWAHSRLPASKPALFWCKHRAHKDATDS